MAQSGVLEVELALPTGLLGSSTVGGVSVRTIRAAITVAPHQFLLSLWPWRALLYLLSGVVVGTALLAVAQLLTRAATMPELLIVGGWGAAVLLLVTLGAPCLARWALFCEGLVHVRETGGRRSRIRLQPIWVRPVMPRAGREIAHAVLSLSVFYVIDVAVIVVALGLPLAGILWFVGDLNLLPIERAVTIGCWALLWPVGMYLVAAWSSVRTEIVRAVLAPREERLLAELSTLSDSRVALAEAFDTERRRIERDLHDGAQQRLVAVQASLGLARLDLPVGSPAARAVEEARTQVSEALTELRDLERGIHPQVLTERGLPAALADVVARAGSPVELELEMPHRLAPSIESTAYFVVCEAIANATKHAPGAGVRVVGRACATGLEITVTDSGPGGARTDGSGLIGLRHRLAVVSGTLTVDSPTGGPTSVRLEIPL